jgi:hypothetical protein
VTYDANYDPNIVQLPTEDAKENLAPDQPTTLSNAKAQNPNFGKVPSYLGGIKQELNEKKA